MTQVQTPAGAKPGGEATPNGVRAGGEAPGSQAQPDPPQNLWIIPKSPPGSQSPVLPRGRLAPSAPTQA